MVWWIVGSVLYVAVACLVMHIIRSTKRRIAGSKHYSRHPEKLKAEFGGFASDLICSILWPFQIIGLLVYGMKG